MRIITGIIFSILFIQVATAQKVVVRGSVSGSGKPLLADISVKDKLVKSTTDSGGQFVIEGLLKGSYQFVIKSPGFKTKVLEAKLDLDTNLFEIELSNLDERLNEVVITGTQRAVNRLESPVPVEIYSAKFFRKNTTPSIFDALQHVNGVRPQLNCNICNTGDIHINGLEGPYTMVLIDGMPIVSSLSTVYGLSGIPNSLVDRIEVVKGPAGSLYGSEAVGGLINIITKQPSTAEKLNVDFMGTGYAEYNLDLGYNIKLSPSTQILTGVNYFKYGNKVDLNGDHFTDVTLQDRVSIFQKWAIQRKDNRELTFAGRYLYEDRWGGAMDWRRSDRGGDVRYGESIYTSRKEVIGRYQLPVNEKVILSTSFTDHHQNSQYGTTSFIATQRIIFNQLTWEKIKRKNAFLMGAALRYTYYDDNTPATATFDAQDGQNSPERVAMPGVFIQNELKIESAISMLAGFRYDYHYKHRFIFTPRFAIKWSPNENNFLRLNAGTGFRVVNLFTEDHAALTGAREVIINGQLRPERSWNVNLNYVRKIHLSGGGHMAVDLTGFYTFFNNRIIGDFDLSPNQIRYENLDGFAESKGVTLNVDLAFPNGLKLNSGVTFQDVSTVEDKIRQHQILTERFSGTWSLSYPLTSLKLNIDYTGSIYGKMRLPLLGEFDPRPEFSPVWSLQNIQFTFMGLKGLEVYGGVKNILNFTPNRGVDFIIARSHDPFDKNVQFGNDGSVLRTPENPYGLTFDPTYVYAPNQGRRVFIGVRLSMK